MGIESKEKKESLDKGLEKTKENIFNRIAKAVVGKTTIDAEVLDNLEEILVTSDVGVSTTLKIITRLEARIARDKYVSTDGLNKAMKEEVAALLEENNSTGSDDFILCAVDEIAL